jgi:hypothetical protein
VRSDGYPWRVFGDKEKECAQCLVLYLGRNFTIHGYVSEVRLNFRFSHIQRMAFVMEEDKAFYPINRALFGSGGIMLGA